ncbi:hypothetical protein NEF87_003263 [Candidatus Lokiarchaeum ossiferum]|uniref:Periplasmic copper-binding protein NosD beta helix domain-containing protein n=1 Tax=Candidatus Lokiarchaeum ossiferum TaxID=2951803 RepID=A0ABY6HTY4_9ARCH|nr:hypothetical protein NEF87_003263 [Candidatus Lokiarchaeum sp. B-35]
MKSYPKLLAIIILISSIFLSVSINLINDHCLDDFNQTSFPQSTGFIQNSEVFISINSDGDLDQFASVSFNGNSSKYPIIIENLSLNNISAGKVISIQNTRKHVLIRNCRISGNSRTTLAIEMINCSNIQIDLNTITKVETGIQWTNISNIIINHNKINASDESLDSKSFDHSENITIIGNELRSNSYPTYLSYIHNLLFEGNLVINDAFRISQCKNVSVLNNTFKGELSFGRGIYLSNVISFKISNNIMETIYKPLSITNSIDGFINNNTILNYFFESLYFSSCDSISVEDNNVTTLGYKYLKYKNFWSTSATNNPPEDFVFRDTDGAGIIFLNTNNSEIINNTINFHTNGIVLVNSIDNFISNNHLTGISNEGIYSTEPDLNIITNNEINTIKIWKEYTLFISYFIVYCVFYLGYLLIQKNVKKESDLVDGKTHEGFENKRKVKEKEKISNFSTLKDIFTYIYFFGVPPFLLLFGYCGLNFNTFPIYTIGFVVMIGIIFALKIFAEDHMTAEFKKKKNYRLIFIFILNLIGGLLGIFIILGKSIEMLRLILITPKFIQIDYSYYFHVIWFTLPLFFLIKPKEIKYLLNKSSQVIEVQ